MQFRVQSAARVGSESALLREHEHQLRYVSERVLRTARHDENVWGWAAVPGLQHDQCQYLRNVQWFFHANCVQ